MAQSGKRRQTTYVSPDAKPTGFVFHLGFAIPRQRDIRLVHFVEFCLKKLNFAHERFILSSVAKRFHIAQCCKSRLLDVLMRLLHADTRQMKTFLFP